MGNEGIMGACEPFACQAQAGRRGGDRFGDEGFEFELTGCANEEWTERLKLVVGDVLDGIQ